MLISDGNSRESSGIVSSPSPSESESKAEARVSLVASCWVSLNANHRCSSFENTLLSCAVDKASLGAVESQRAADVTAVLLARDADPALLPLVDNTTEAPLSTGPLSRPQRGIGLAAVGGERAFGTEHRGRSLLTLTALTGVTVLQIGLLSELLRLPSASVDNSCSSSLCS